VLITGESGSGKELVARALHFSGPRRKQQYLSINCAALPDALLESELFGYCEGAFTDARRDKKGLFAMADGGTLFLDEVGDMSLTMQAKLLRVLQEGEFAPLGAEQVMKVDVRIVAATNRDLKAMVKAGTFRQDLYYRLDVVSIRVPPLRERKEDIPLLVEHFLDAFAQRSEQERTRMSLQAMQVLMAYHWPGNVRELQSVVTTSAVFADEGVVTTESLRTKPEVFAGAGHASSAVPNLETLNLRDLEKQAVILALRRTEGNKQKAAKVLGISRRALYNKLEAYGIESDKIL
jgi:transcriptional regulator with PAS, ATPase and Fis domain